MDDKVYLGERWTNMPTESGAVYEKYQKALDKFIGRITKDPYIEAVYIYGSMVNGILWDKSDIDVILVGKDEKYSPFSWYTLVEDDVIFNALVFNRSQFKINHERGHTKDWTFMFYKSRLVYAKDSIYEEYLKKAETLGDSDRQQMLLKTSSMVVTEIQKAKKWLFVRKDMERCFTIILSFVQKFAELIVLLDNKIPQEYSVNQAMEINRTLFDKVFTRLIHSDKNWDVLNDVLNIIENFIEERIHILFKPILDYMTGQNEEISMTKLVHHMQKKQWVSEFFMVDTLEWLTEKGVLERYETPVILGKGSRVYMNEISYYYPGQGE
jgi:predicted nucleotidyltransferase